jgi:hypothetical protein
LTVELRRTKNKISNSESEIPVGDVVVNWPLILKNNIVSIIKADGMNGIRSGNSGSSKI